MYFFKTDFKRYLKNSHIIIVALTLFVHFASHSAPLKSQMVKMSDGVHLSTDIYFSGKIDKARPTILIRTVYNKNNTYNWNPVWQALVEQDYAVVIQDIRGRFESEGIYNIAKGRRKDGVETLDWIIKQPWSNGKVGLSGCSYLGEAQVVLEATNHPALIVGQPQSAASGYYRPGRAWQSFSGGAFELGQTAGWFASNGTKVFYGPNLTGAERSEWFNQKEANEYKMSPDFDFNKYLENIKALPTINLLSLSGAAPSDYSIWRDNAPDGEYFHTLDLVNQNDSVSVPNLFFDTWYDYGARETLMMAEQFRQTAKTKIAQQHQYVIIGPGTHCNFPQKPSELSAGERPLTNTELNYKQLQISWFNKWLKEERNEITKRPFLTYYVLGENKWRYADQWPLKNTQYTNWYLDNNKGANSIAGDGKLSLNKPASLKSDSFIYDPSDPVPSLGGHTCCTGSDTEAGGYDQSSIEQRDDILVYTSDKLTSGIEVTGLLKAKLFVSSSAKDTDFTVKIIDVYPDGKAYNVQEGALRMRYRDSLKDESFMVEGKVYPIEVDLNATSNYFAPGHKIRIEISSSNFPRIERNLNTGEPNHLGTTFIKANNTIFLGAEYASHIELPVIPRNHSD
ncbi:CocE/NonD family hydrolase [Thalassotalea nanhaiensis]|uniref:CocE/NonD family hydrolase n=1 Tax=Thalassotalea nanhaiensis TaxID=3065648 RepID=A0ABY9TG20_9GAMM|nr:CocE/NonD family hydrolase [Colwelliaceae bacterium SQ345]